VPGLGGAGEDQRQLALIAKYFEWSTIFSEDQCPLLGTML